MTTGIDIEEVQRFKNLVSNKPELLQKMFSDYEWNYASQKNRAQTLAGIWCAKESVVKALYAKGICKMIRDVQIHHNSDGVPQVQCIEGIENFNLEFIRLSISHTMNYAVAVCVIEN